MSTAPRAEGEETRVRPGSVRAWMLAARPKTLPAALAPVMVGSAVAASHGALRPVAAAAAAVGALAIQIATNFANDVHDYERGADREDRLGPLRVTQAGLISPRGMRWGVAAAFALACVCGAYLAAVSGWPIVIVGLASLTAGLAYTAGPFPLAYNCLGDLFVFLFFGFIAVCGTVWVQMLSVPAAAVWCAVGVGALATAILAVNNVRDEPTDRIAGKRTLPVVFGRRAGIGEYFALIGIAFAVPPSMVWSGVAPAPALAAWLASPYALRLAWTVAHRTDGPGLNDALAGTARLLLLYSVLLSAGLLA